MSQQHRSLPHALGGATFAAGLLAASACSAAPEPTEVPAALQIYLAGASGLSMTRNTYTVVLARLLARDSTPLGTVPAAWSSGDTSVVVVRDTVVAGGPAAAVSSRQPGHTTVQATYTVGGRVLQASLPVTVYSFP